MFARNIKCANLYSTYNQWKQHNTGLIADITNSFNPKLNPTPSCGLYLSHVCNIMSEIHVSCISIRAPIGIITFQIISQMKFGIH